MTISFTHPEQFALQEQQYIEVSGGPDKSQVEHLHFFIVSLEVVRLAGTR